MAATPQKPNKSKGAGRPTKYEAEFARQARVLVLGLNASDDNLAEFFGITIVQLAIWARDNEDFYRAITPTLKEKSDYDAEKAARREIINSRKRKARKKRPSLAIENAMRARMYAALKGHTTDASLRRLGYSISDLVQHLSERFSEGMSWENYGKWHIDHIRPCASFDQSDEAQFRECWALTNLQPLWASDNIRKGAKYASS